MECDAYLELPALLQETRSGEKRGAEDIPMVQMMEVRRKFFAGTISVLSLACHSSFIRLLRWSREELAAIVDDLCE